MKVYVSADMEGVAGATDWADVERGKPGYSDLCRQMTAEVAAACRGALAAGADQVWVQDAHDTGRNLIAAELPPEAKLIRGWSGHPFSMVQELDSSFQALLMVGYHSGAGRGSHPLAHTLSGRLAAVRLNGELASEFTLHAYAAAYHRVPVAFVSGDAALCEEASRLSPAVGTCPVTRGAGGATISVHPQMACQQIEHGVQAALQGDLGRYRLSLPAQFAVEVAYRDHGRAVRAAFYPGARLTTPFCVGFDADDYFEVLRFLSFVG
ncbi:MAG: M55 family metallopeptidase [Candidatus Bipolaricaulaceae bacterium]